MTTTSNATLVLGRGELYFDRFTAGTLKGEGELYLGNTPGFTLTRTVEETERFTSYGGQQIKIDSVVTREIHSAEIITDNISMENVAFWFGSDADHTGQIAIGTISETLVVKKGRWYQLGTSVAPFGVRHIEPDLTILHDGSPIDRDANLIIARTEGRFFVLDDAADITDGESLVITFQWRQSSTVNVVDGTEEVVGALRYLSKNVVGDQINYFFPYVRLAPASNIDFKADDWQKMSFNVDIRRLNAITNFIYVNRTAGPLRTEDEQAIIDLGPLSLDQFPYWEDQLDQIINTFMPEADYGQAITYP